jgi:hypothetical protein
MVALRVARKTNAYAVNESARATIRSRIRSLLIGLEIPDEGRLYTHEANFSGLTEDFVREARALDPEIPDSFIGQALRNLWIFASLQVLLSGRACLTPAGMAYSLLYPYTDNYVDDLCVSIFEKRNFVDRLNQKLRGLRLEPSSSLEERVYRLVDIIAAQYPRTRNPLVHESLLAIHQAQTGSMYQQRSKSAQEAEILPLTIRKGGTSVLADAYLVKGELAPEEFDFAFQYGVVLQLIDDFQDIRDDDARRSRTLFTTVHNQPELEQRCSKTFHLVSVLGESGVFRNLHEGEPFHRIIQAGCRMLLYEGIAANLAGFRAEYIDSIEQHCPVSFSVLGRLKSRMPD